MTHYTMCGAAQGENSCFVPWCTCPCHDERTGSCAENRQCPHDSLSGAEGPVAELGRMPTRWRCDECGAVIEYPT